VACCCSLDVYDAIRADRNQDKVNDETRKRKAKVAYCKWVACWRVLRQSDMFSGAANGGDASGMDFMGDTSYDEEEKGSGCGSGRSRRNGGFQSRPVGIKAANMRRQENVQMDAQVKANTEALHNLTDAQHERTTLFFFELPLMRHTPEAGRYRLAIAQNMLERAGVARSSAIDVGGGEGTDDSIDCVGDGIADLGVDSSTGTVRAAAGPAAEARAQPGRGALAAPLGADGTFASALAAAAAAKAAPAHVRRQAKTVAGRRSLETKLQAAAAQLALSPNMTRNLDEDSESSNDSDDSE